MPQAKQYPCAKCGVDTEDLDYVTIQGGHYCEDCAPEVEGEPDTDDEE